MNKVIEQIIEIAKEVESEDPIDWGLLNVSEDEAYHLCALSIYELYQDMIKSDSPDVMIMSTMLKLVVENFVLNTKLLQRGINEQIKT